MSKYELRGKDRHKVIPSAALRFLLQGSRARYRCANEDSSAKTVESNSISYMSYSRGA
jgi:hypothetical protein